MDLSFAKVQTRLVLEPQNFLNLEQRLDLLHLLHTLIIAHAPELPDTFERFLTLRKNVRIPPL